MITAMTAGNNENKDQIICRTASASVMVMTVWSVTGSVPEMNPAKPRNRATSEPLMAVPNFCDIVPEEKMTPLTTCRSSPWHSQPRQHTWTTVGANKVRCRCSSG